MIQELNCSGCGINGADTDLIAIPMSFVCHKCYGKTDKQIKELEAENKELKKGRPDKVDDLYFSLGKAAKRIQELENEVQLYRGGKHHKESCPRYQCITNRCDCGVLSKS